jgi:hypothetical protein
MQDIIADVIRREVERTDTLCGFQIIHNLAGGTGSGMTDLVWKYKI